MKRNIFYTFLMFALITLISSCENINLSVSLNNPFISSEENSSTNHESKNIIYEDFQIHFLELGVYNTGDSTYIKAGDTDILIDAGAAAASAPTIIDYVNQYCDDGTLEYVITTHSHDDHYEAMFGNSKSTTNYFNQTIERTGILYYYNIKTIIDFSQTTKDPSKGNYKKYIDARNYAISNGAKHFTAKQCFEESDGASRQYILDTNKNITMDILYNKYYFEQSNDENDHSVCTMFNYNDHHFMMTGDLEEKGEKALADYYDKSTPEKTLPHVDLFKAGHHGSKTSSNKVLLDLITPDICCVCCCAGSSEYTIDNAKTFPTQEFIDRIALYTDNVFVTSAIDSVESKKQGKHVYKSLNGTITISCNGTQIGISATNNIIKLKDSDWFNEKIYVIESEKGIQQIASGNKKSDYFNESDENVKLITRRVWPTI